MFAKKNAQLEEQIMQDITDEQLGQVTGGSLAYDGVSALSTATGLVSGLINGVGVSGIQVNAAGINVSTPALSTNGLISGLL